MLKTKMTVRFYDQAGDPDSVSLRYRMDPARELRPAFKLGDQLFSGSIVTDEEELYNGVDYPVQVWFRTIDSSEVYGMVEEDLHIEGKAIGLAIKDVQLLALLGTHIATLAALLDLPETGQACRSHEAVDV